MKLKTPPKIIGWREWAALPDLGIGQIKAKVDTGARTSALHAFAFEPFHRDGAPWLRFRLHPFQRSSASETLVEAPQVDERWVRPSSGVTSLRPVITTRLRLGEDLYSIQITLVRRDLMGFRLLLGRRALRGRYLIDPRRSYLTGRQEPPPKETGRKRP
jgi:hypothetical protein